jgi:hypothetical protein
MPTTYTPDPTNNPTSVTLPSDGDYKPVASVTVALEAALDMVKRAMWPADDDSKSYPLKSQTLFRHVHYVALPQETDGNGNALSGPKWVYELAYWLNLDVSGGVAGYLDVPLDLPDGCTLNFVHVYLAGATGLRTHSSLPGVMPKMRVFRIKALTDVSDTMSSLTTDPSASVATYDAVHAVPVTVNAFQVIDRTLYRYFVRVQGEASTNAVASALRLVGVAIEATITAQDKGAA